MLYFVYLLRILGAILITNSHYEAIYPHSFIANGGLLGDVLFFAVSGFCLYPIRKSFFQWCGMRLKRIYPLVWLITLVYLLLGFYEAQSFQAYIKLLFYPTYYHFVASILVLYLVYYPVAKLIQAGEANGNRRLGIVLTALVVLYFTIYFTLYDRSYYHIDTVREPMIEFLYFAAMMIGLYFRLNQERYIGKPCPWSWLCAIGLFAAYFASKTGFSRGMLSSQLQFVNQWILLLLLYCLFRGFSGLEDRLRRLPEKLRQILVYVAGFAFEIYLVQYALIPRLNIGPFPLNFLLVSVGILLSALILHIVHDQIMKGIGKLRS
jgi:hypothetical protein